VIFNTKANEAAAHILPTLTRAELTALIAKRPEVWGRYSKWLETLPEPHDCKLCGQPTAPANAVVVEGVKS